jgi:hypothetical protein
MLDLAEVRSFTSTIARRMAACDNGEGVECATLDSLVATYAELCLSYLDELRHWHLEVFSGRVAFDPETERLWKATGEALYRRAAEVQAYGSQAAQPCFVIEAQPWLEAWLSLLDCRLKKWMTPRLAVGPSVRIRIEDDSAAYDRVKEIIAALPSLPSDWQPDDARQRVIFRTKNRAS